MSSKVARPEFTVVVVVLCTLITFLVVAVTLLQQDTLDLRRYDTRLTNRVSRLADRVKWLEEKYVP